MTDETVYEEVIKQKNEDIHRYIRQIVDLEEEYNKLKIFYNELEKRTKEQTHMLKEENYNLKKELENYKAGFVTCTTCGLKFKTNL